MGDLVIILGNKNRADGELSVAAKMRCAKAVEVVATLPNDAVIITAGGFGDFNTCDMSHAALLENELVSLGIDRDRFLPRIISSGTHQDAIGLLRQVADMSFTGNVHVVTSSFHMKRVKRVFGHFLARHNLVFHEASHECSLHEIEHEVQSLRAFETLKTNIGLAVDSSSPDLERLVAELRHYDLLSYYALTASFLVVVFTYSRFSEMSRIAPIGVFSVAQFILAVAVSVGFLTVYERFAETAWIFRTLSKDLSFYLRKGDISNGPVKKLAGLKTKTWMQLIFTFGWIINLLQLFRFMKLY